MKHILKSTEPVAWKNWCKTPGAGFRAIPELKEALLNEQGYICCYCMKRIDAHTMDVEHWQTQTARPELRMAYTNLMASCVPPTVFEGEEHEHCNRKRDSLPLGINPLDRLANCDETISYNSKDGKVVCTDFQNDLDNILNLNCKPLMRNRKGVIDATVQVMNKTLSIAQKNTRWKKQALNKEMKRWSSKDDDGMFREYCMVAVYYLKKKLRQL